MAAKRKAKAVSKARPRAVRSPAADGPVLEKLAVCESLLRSLHDFARTTPVGGVPSEGVARLRDVAEELAEVARGLHAAIGALPREEDYLPAARQLRELASVSPSLLDWLADVPRLSAPLAGSVAGLREAAERVTSARASVLSVLSEWEPGRRS
jgi:hypothetical protein